jgi:recombination protein RecA
MDLVIGRSAMLTNKFMRKAISAAGRSLIEHDRNVLVLVINQWRERVGVIYGDSRTTPGGLGKNYTYATRAEVSRTEWLKDGDQRVGQTIKAQTIKNKTAPPRRSGEVDFYFAPSGGHQAGSYDTERDVWSVATEQEVLERHGAWYHFGKHKWNGKDAVWAAMKDDPALITEIDTEVRRQLGLPTPQARSAPATRKRRAAK